MINDDNLQELLDLYNTSDYPEEFVSKYDMMECLSEQDGICTLLVQNKKSISYIAKCYDKSKWDINNRNYILNNLNHQGLPKHVETYENDTMTVSVREYINGMPLSQYSKENNLTKEQIVSICLELCDILSYLHHQDPPIIHRDIKPQNIIVRPDNSICLIDFDIARVYQHGLETDTRVFGTRDYAPPEQYGFSQTDSRADIYSLGILLRFLMTGSTKENNNITIYRPLDKIIEKCTNFAPKDRFSDISQVKKALLHANPRSQHIRVTTFIIFSLLAVGLVAFIGTSIYKKATYSPFGDDTIPAYMSDDDRISDAISYMKDKYGTDMFDKADDTATVKDLRTALIELYGLDHDYVYGINKDMPQESNEYFLPWGWDDNQTVDRDIAVYAAVKAHDPSIVSDWSSIKDDNGFYPGVRVAVAFAEKHNMTEGANRPGDILIGDLALIFANADRVFDSVQDKHE